jgi:hypothetical protein
MFDTGALFGRIAASVEGRRVDQLDMDAAILHCLDLAISTSLRAAASISTHSLIDLVAIMPIFWRQLQHCAVNFLVNRQHVIERLFSPFPPEIKRVFFHRTIL